MSRQNDGRETKVLGKKPDEINADPGSGATQTVEKKSSLIGSLIVIASTIIWFGFLGPYVSGKIFPEIGNIGMLFATSLLFLPAIAIGYYLYPYEIEEGKLKKAILIITIVAIATTSIKWYITTPTHPNFTKQSCSQNKISAQGKSLSVGSYTFLLQKDQQTPWLQIPGNMVYDIFLEDGKGDFIVYYDDGTVVEFRDGENKKLPKKQLATFKITALKNNQDFQITVMERKKI